MRKEAIAAAAIVAILTLSSCKSGDIGKISLNPTKIEQTIPATSSWENLSAMERTNRLELKNFPKNLDVDTEIVKAISELYSQQMPSKISKETMQSNIHFVDTSTFLKKAQEEAGRPLLNSERKIVEASPEWVFNAENSDRTKRQVYINQSRISTLTAEIRKSLSAQEMKNLGNYDLETIVKESTISHAISHLNQSDEKFDFSTGQTRGAFFLTGIHGLDLQIINFNDGSSFELTGVDEAMTDIMGSLVNRTSDIYVFSRTYYPAKVLIEELNKKAGIDNNELKEYYFGNKSIKDFLIEWGSIKDPKKPSISSGIYLYFLVASSIEAGNDPNSIRQTIEKEIGQKLNIPTFAPIPTVNTN